jgi:hypothetical protein
VRQLLRLMRWPHLHALLASGQPYPTSACPTPAGSTGILGRIHDRCQRVRGHAAPSSITGFSARAAPRVVEVHRWSGSRTTSPHRTWRSPSFRGAGATRAHQDHGKRLLRSAVERGDEGCQFFRCTYCISSRKIANAVEPHGRPRPPLREAPEGQVQVTVVGKAGLWVEIHANFDILVSHLRAFAKPARARRARCAVPRSPIP